MDYVKVVYSIFILLSPLLGKAEIAELATKQPIQNIRFLTSDGLHTYFQNKRGKLMYAANYNITTILQKPGHTQYTIYASPVQKYLIVEVEPDYFELASFFRDHELYMVPFKRTRATLIAHGVSPRLHENDGWLSAYSYSRHLLTFINLEAPLIKIKIKIKNRIFPYFIPEALLFNNKLIFYTDINRQGRQGLILYNRETKEKKLFLNSEVLTQTFQLCQNEQSIFILQTGLDSLTSGTHIYQLDKKDTINIKALKLIYNSPYNDIGNMICNFEKDKIFFTKTQQPTKYSVNKNIVVELNTLNQKIKTLYNGEYSFTLLTMDKHLLVNTKGRYYILKGPSHREDDSLQ